MKIKYFLNAKSNATVWIFPESKLHFQIHGFVESLIMHHFIFIWFTVEEYNLKDWNNISDWNVMQPLKQPLGICFSALNQYLFLYEFLFLWNRQFPCVNLNTLYISMWSQARRPMEYIQYIKSKKLIKIQAWNPSVDL